MVAVPGSGGAASCAVTPAREPGRSLLGDSLLDRSLEAVVQRLNDALPGLHWIQEGMEKVGAAITSPFVWWEAATTWVAQLLGWVLEFVYSLVRPLGLETEASLVLSTIALVLVCRIFLYLPIRVRAHRNALIQHLIQPQVVNIQRKYKGKRDAESQKRFQEETLQLYRASKSDPLRTYLPILIAIPLLGGLWGLMKALLSLGDSGRLKPGLIGPESALSTDLTGLTGVSVLGMDVAIPPLSLGVCRQSLPYLVTLGVLILCQLVVSRHAFVASSQSGAGPGVMVLGLVLAGAVAIPILIILLRIADSLYLIGEQAYLMRRTRKLRLRLRDDPDFYLSLIGALPKRATPDPTAGATPDQS